MHVPLSELEPRWLRGPTSEDPRERHGMGISFLCPVCRKQRIAIMFANPIDGLPPARERTHLWQRQGDTFQTLSLQPSVDASVPGQHLCAPTEYDVLELSHWHGFITNGVCT